MRKFLEDTLNLIYYDKEAMEESIRIIDLNFAKEEGIKWRWEKRRMKWKICLKMELIFKRFQNILNY